jgi:hypothetical protein
MTKHLLRGDQSQFHGVSDPFSSESLNKIATTESLDVASNPSTFDRHGGLLVSSIKMHEKHGPAMPRIPVELSSGSGV